MCNSLVLKRTKKRICSRYGNYFLTKLINDVAESMSD
jgi:hypothetical protein